MHESEITGRKNINSIIQIEKNKLTQLKWNIIRIKTSCHSKNIMKVRRLYYILGVFIMNQNNTV